VPCAGEPPARLGDRKGEILSYPYLEKKALSKFLNKILRAKCTVFILAIYLIIKKGRSQVF
jgi:hypothetical protein